MRRLIDKARGASVELRSDPQHWTSALLIADNLTIGAIGGICSILAARLWPPRDVGSVSAVVGALGFIVTIATLGMPSTVVRFLNRERNQASLMRQVLAVTLGLGGIAALAVAFVPGHLGVPITDLHAGPAVTALLVTVYVTMSVVGAVSDPAFLARQEVSFVFRKDVAASAARVLVLLAFAGTNAAGLLCAMTLYVMIAALVDLGMLRWRLRDDDRPTTRSPPFHLLRGRANFAIGSHIATVISLAPTLLLATLVGASLGPASAAFVAIPMQINALLTVIPSMTAQSLMAELSARPEALLEPVRKALRAAYATTIPLAIVIVIAAPVIMSLFGHRYEVHASGTLRWLAASSVFFVFNYAGDIVLLARGRMAAYVVVNLVGTLAVMAAVVFAITQRLSLVGPAWFVAQGIYAATSALTISRFASRADLRAAVLGRRPFGSSKARRPR